MFGHIKIDVGHFDRVYYGWRLPELLEERGRLIVLNRVRATGRTVRRLHVVCQKVKTLEWAAVQQEIAKQQAAGSEVRTVSWAEAHGEG